MSSDVPLSLNAMHSKFREILRTSLSHKNSIYSTDFYSFSVYKTSFILWFSFSSSFFFFWKLSVVAAVRTSSRYRLYSTRKDPTYAQADKVALQGPRDRPRLNISKYTFVRALLPLLFFLWQYARFLLCCSTAAPRTRGILCAYIASCFWSHRCGYWFYLGFNLGNGHWTARMERKSCPCLPDQRRRAANPYNALPPSLHCTWRDPEKTRIGVGPAGSWLVEYKICALSLDGRNR